MEEGRRKTERRETETTEQKQRQTRRFSLRIEESETRFEIRPTISIKRYRRSFLSLSLSQTGSRIERPVVGEVKVAAAVKRCKVEGVDKLL